MDELIWMDIDIQIGCYVMLTYVMLKAFIWYLYLSWIGFGYQCIISLGISSGWESHIHNMKYLNIIKNNRFSYRVIVFHSSSRLFFVELFCISWIVWHNLSLYRIFWWFHWRFIIIIFFIWSSNNSNSWGSYNQIESNWSRWSI